MFLNKFIDNFSNNIDVIENIYVSGDIDRDETGIVNYEYDVENDLLYYTQPNFY